MTQRTALRRLRAIAPWVAGLAILGAIAARIPFAAFSASLGRGSHVKLALWDVLLTATMLCTDSVSVWVGLIAVRLRRPYAQVTAVRGATYILFLLNYMVGQGTFGYYLYRSGTSARRATGTTLFLMGTNLAGLLLLTTAAFALHGGTADAQSRAISWTLAAGCIALALYLVAIAARPGALGRRELLAPLFDAGVGGHALAIAARLPHVALIVVGQWVAMRAWGIQVPIWAGLTLLPVVVFISALPISPMGLGTTQAALVFFFSGYATGATAGARAGAIFAFAIAHYVYGIVASLLVGFACAPFARRLGAVAGDDAQTTSSSGSGNTSRVGA